jgi:hypothetical protein
VVLRRVSQRDESLTEKNPKTLRWRRSERKDEEEKEKKV